MFNFYAFLKRSWAAKAFLGVLIVALFYIVFTASSQRLIKFDDSISQALQYESHNSWITQNSWKTEFCQHLAYATCDVDASIYLRFSWAHYALRSVIQYPLGIGPTPYPLKVMLQRDYPNLAKDTIYDDFHSELLDILVCFGAPGLLLFISFILLVGRSVIQTWKSKPPDVLQIALAFIILGLMGRTVFDTFSYGLWFTLFALVGGMIGLASDTVRNFETRRYSSRA